MFSLKGLLGRQSGDLKSIFITFSSASSVAYWVENLADTES